MNYYDYLKLSADDEVVPAISTSNAKEVYKFLPNKYKRALVFWSITWKIWILLSVILTIFYNWKLFPLVFVGFLIRSGNQMSLGQFVLQYASENEVFFNILVNKKLIELRRSERVIEY